MMDDRIEIAKKFIGKNDEILWQGKPYGRRSKKDTYYISTQHIFSIFPSYTGDMHVFDYSMVHYFVSDIEYFFIDLNKKGTPNIYDLYFETRPLSEEHYRKSLINCNINKGLPLDDEFYITFVLDNGWNYKSPKLPVILIRMDKISDVEGISMVLRNKLGIREELSPSEVKKKKAQNFHTLY